MKRITRIYASDFEGFASEVAADIWNRLIVLPSFRSLKPADYAGLFQSVLIALLRYRRAAEAASRRAPRSAPLPDR
jgi:hypothetical protein